MWKRSALEALPCLIRMVVLSHPTGNANVRAALHALDSAGLLSFFSTTLAATGVERLSFLPARLREEAARRSYPVASAKIRQRPLSEALRLVAVKLSHRRMGGLLSRLASMDRVWQDLDRSTARLLTSRIKGDAPSAVYCYEDGALQSFRRASRMGLRCIYDLPIGYFKSAQRIFAEESDLCPEFADALSLDGGAEPMEKLERKEQEASLATTIIACSPFVHQTLVEGGVEAGKIQTVQFGSPAGIKGKEYNAPIKNRPLRFLFVGLVIQRKGIGYLLRAKKSLGRKVELIVMGRMPARPESILKYKHLFEYEPPRPHAQVLELMKSCDVLVLPSLFEGQALVVLEAMKCGLPVIITPNTGAGDLVDEGQSGFVVPIRSESVLAEKMEWFADHKDAVEAMGLAASAKAAGLTWESYGRQIVHIVQSALGTQIPRL